MIDFRKIRNLKLPIGEYCVFGSGPMDVAGIRDSNDIDIVVKEKLWKEFAHKYPVEKNPKSHKFSISIGNIEIFKDLKPWVDDSDEVIDSSEVVEGVSFASLEDVKRIKRAMGRPKGLEDIKLIDEYLGN